MKHCIKITLHSLAPDAVLRAFQQAADAHAQMMGVGYEDMLKRGLLWVVTRIRYEVVKPPAEGQTVQLMTWPLPASRLGYERNYLITDEKGETLIKGASLWVVIDPVSRKLAIGDDLYPQGEYCTDRPFADRGKRLRDFEGTPAYTVVPGEEYIDRNGHVNNTHYAAFAAKALGDPTPCAFQIDYAHEVLCGQPLHLFTATEEGALLAKGCNEDGLTMFTCKMQVTSS